MTSNRLAAAAALLAAVLPSSARAEVIDLLDSLDGGGSITFTSQTSFSKSGVLDGDASYIVGPTAGTYGFPTFMGLGGPPSTFNFDGVGAFMEGTVEWTAAVNSPTAAELSGELTITSNVIGSAGEFTAQFLADFPVGAVDPITVMLGSAAGTGVNCPIGVPSCYVIDHGRIVGGPAPTPEPASLVILAGALGIFLMAYRRLRAPEKGIVSDTFS